MTIRATPAGVRAVSAPLALAALVALVAGCSSASSPTSSPPPAASQAATSAAAATPSAPATSAPASSPTATAGSGGTGGAAGGTPSCATRDLKVAAGLAQGAAGSVYQVIDFTNISGATCTLFGYPGVSLVSGPPYAQIGLAAKRTNTAPVKQITLAPDATANALLQIVDALNFPASTCSPTKSTNLRVFPPNWTASVYLPYATEGCAKPVQTLFIGAVQAGSGGSS